MTVETKHIQEYSLLDFVQKLEQAFAEGYVSNVELNEGVPQAIAHCLSVVLYKKPQVDLQVKPEVQPVVETVEASAVQPQKQRGRPATK